MRKICLLLVVTVIAGIGASLVLRYAKSVGSDTRPEILDISNSQVTIAWLSEEVDKGRVFYKRAGSDASPLSAVGRFAASCRHEVVIAGLSPATRYTYWIGGSKNRFQFQTQPLPNTPFSFLMVWGDISERIVSLVMSEMPEFIISLTAIPDKGPDRFSDVRPYVPIYGPNSVDSVYLKVVRDEKRIGWAGSWKLDWGGLRLVFVDRVADAAGMLSTSAAHTIGIITSSEIVETFKPGNIIDRSTIQQNPLHSVLITHNRQNPERLAAFVGVVGEKDHVIEVNGVRYFGIPAKRKRSEAEKGTCTGAIRLDVDVESARAFFIDEKKEVALKSPPLMQRRTCEECRRLADKGAYEESVQAYKDFIKTHQGHFQIDDAYFAVAEIFDEKLFSFEEALVWYRRLIDEYPDGTLTPLASQRIKYLSVYSDYDYRPLVRFERIRKVEFARKKRRIDEREKLLAEVKSIIKEYPNSKLAPVMQYWLANQYRQSDADKAVDTYKRLKREYPNHPDAREVLIEVGQTYYEAGRYEEAKEAYKEALLELPSLRDEIKIQIARCKRNIRRVWIALVCWAVVALMSALGILGKPFGVGKRTVVLSLAAFAVLASLLLFGAWLIHEQFSSSGEMTWLAVSFSASAAVSSLISMTLAEKLFTKVAADVGVSRRIVSLTAGSVMGVILFMAGIYLAIYYINVHYLIVVGM